MVGFSDGDPRKGCFHLQRCYCMLAGQWKKLRFWTDKWVDDVDIQQIVPHLFKLTKHVARRHLVEDLLPEARWMQDISGPLSVPSIVEAMCLFERLNGFILTDVPDGF